LLAESWPRVDVDTFLILATDPVELTVLDPRVTTRQSQAKALEVLPCERSEGQFLGPGRDRWGDPTRRGRLHPGRRTRRGRGIGWLRSIVICCYRHRRLPGSLASPEASFYPPIRSATKFAEGAARHPAAAERRWDRSGIQRRFRSSGERHHQLLV